MKPQSQAKPIIVGRSIELSQLHIVALYDPESGAVLHRHSVVVVKGGKDVREEDAVREAYARANAFHARLEKDPVEIRKMAGKGQVLYPIAKLKVAVSNDPRHLEMELRVDSKSGKLVELPDDEHLERRETGRA